MKILYIIPSLSIGGAEKLTVDVLSLLKEKGYDVSLLTLKSDRSFLYDILIKSGVPIFSLNAKNIYSPTLIYSLKNYIKSYDLIHVHLFPTLYWVALSKTIFRLKNIKLVFTEHSTYNKRRNKNYLKLIEKFVYNKYDKIICISEQVKNNLSKWLNCSYDNKFITIYNGININLFKNAVGYTKDSLGLPSNAKVLLMVGRFSHAKDQKTLVKALKIISDKNIYLLFSGDGELRPEIEAFTQEVEVSNNVRFLGSRTDIPNLIKTSDICILSSNWEGFGLSVVEYMAAGKPTIASDIDGLGDIVRGAGILFEKNNELDLANKIKLLLEDDKEYKKIQTQCLNKASLFDINNTVEQYFNLYKNLFS